ncbi:MAG TPA: hypothetical protein VNX67_04755 [Solirubrobacteraceae bacterium]|nr:hypothetical protein [Solirubrobacteraceae bacterium]
MYRVELRQFPHNFCRFNLTEQELRKTVLDGWARGDWIDFGERKWNPHQAKLTVLEGPELPVQQLSMGRGWRGAMRQGTDVTEHLLASARARDSITASTTSEPARPFQSATNESAMDSDTIDRKRAENLLAQELLVLLGDDPSSLIRAWRLALERHPDRTPSECLALAEDFVGR